MPNQISSYYQSAGQGAVASYSWTDILQRAGYINFYVTGEPDVEYSSPTWFLTNSVREGRPISIDFVSTGRTTYNFDFTFNTPQIIEPRTAFFVYTKKLQTNAGNLLCTLRHRLYHYDGTTSTLIGTASESDLRTSGAGNLYYRISLKMTITARKKFKIGDTLRLTTDLTTGTGHTDIYTNPAAEATFTEEGTGYTIADDFVISIPFRIEI